MWRVLDKSQTNPPNGVWPRERERERERERRRISNRYGVSDATMTFTSGVIFSFSLVSSWLPVVDVSFVVNSPSELIRVEPKELFPSIIKM